jgi:hypothetical protein
MLRYLIALLCFFLSSTALAVESSEQLQLLIEQKQFKKAVRSGEKILLQDPGNARARFLTAYAYQMNSNTDKAILLYQELIQDNPSLPEPRNNLAMIYLSRGDYDGASQLLVDAINTHSSYATAYANLRQVYTGIASELYRRAVSESSEPAKYTNEIELTAITALNTLESTGESTQQIATLSKPVVNIATDVAPKATVDVASKAVAEPASKSTPKTVVKTANYNTLLIENVRNWAGAWSNKQFDKYTGSYTDDYRAKFNTHSQWVKHRRSRVLRPGKIKVVVSNFTVKLRDDNRASVDFIQAFTSPGYSDRVVKRLDFNRIGSQWKITVERVLSVL